MSGYASASHAAASSSVSRRPSGPVSNTAISDSALPRSASASASAHSSMASHAVRPLFQSSRAMRGAYVAVLRQILFILAVVFLALILLEFIGWIDVFSNVGEAG